MTKKQKKALAKARRAWKSMSPAARKRARGKNKRKIVHAKGHSRHLHTAAHHLERAHRHLRAALKGKRVRKGAKFLL